MRTNYILVDVFLMKPDGPVLKTVLSGLYYKFVWNLWKCLLTPFPSKMVPRSFHQSALPNPLYSSNLSSPISSFPSATNLASSLLADPNLYAPQNPPLFLLATNPIHAKQQEQPFFLHKSLCSREDDKGQGWICARAIRAMALDVAKKF